MHIKNRLYGSTKNIPLDSLVKIFQDEKLSYIKLAILFGSRANNSQTVQSDYDFAILADNSQDYRWGALSKAYNDIGDILNLKEYDYDIVDMENANDLIKQSIRMNYIILKGEEDELQRVFTSN